MFLLYWIISIKQALQTTNLPSSFIFIELSSHVSAPLYRKFLEESSILVSHLSVTSCFLSPLCPEPSIVTQRSKPKPLAQKPLLCIMDPQPVTRQWVRPSHWSVPQWALPTSNQQLETTVSEGIQATVE